MLQTDSTIEDSGKHLLALINDILDLSKIEVYYNYLNTPNHVIPAKAGIQRLMSIWKDLCDELIG